jgi:hypothetical protein
MNLLANLGLVARLEHFDIGSQRAGVKHSIVEILVKFSSKKNVAFKSFILNPRLLRGIGNVLNSCQMTVGFPHFTWNVVFREMLRTEDSAEKTRFATSDLTDDGEQFAFPDCQGDVAEMSSGNRARFAVIPTQRTTH